MAQIDALKKEARRLENEIDVKLVTLTKCCALNNLNTRQQGDDVPLLSSEHKYESTQDEIEGLLKELTGINNQMMESSSSYMGDSVVLHVFKRHNDILQDYTNEFNRIRRNYETRKERELLLESARKNNSHHRIDHPVFNRRMDLQLKENQHIKSSNTLVDDQINVAIETREHLISQRQNIKRLQTRLHDISNRFPVLNVVIQRINFRKRRDSIILGLVVSVCTLLLLLYAFH